MRMAGIVRDLLEQGSPGRGREKATIEKLLSEAISAFRPMAQANGVAILCDLGAEAESATRAEQLCAAAAQVLEDHGEAPQDA